MEQKKPENFFLISLLLLGILSKSFFLYSFIVWHTHTHRPTDRTKPIYKRKFWNLSSPPHTQHILVGFFFINFCWIQNNRILFPFLLILAGFLPFFYSIILIAYFYILSSPSSSLSVKLVFASLPRLNYDFFRVILKQRRPKNSTQSSDLILLARVAKTTKKKHMWLISPQWRWWFNERCLFFH